MNTRDQFGNYLLLKKLSEDALGESFRAGRIGKGGLERVVLLRVFNGQGLDGDKLGQRMQVRAPVQAALKSPNLGQGVDLGQVRGVPYVAYDYVSGRSLAPLVEQAAKKRTPIPLDHGLLMAERIALGLAVAYETRVGEERVLHGCTTPHLVLVSNEGELRLLGFEASTGLREFAGHPLMKDAVGRYLAPEVLAGQPPAKADDVYSLGAILFELLTAQRVPAYSAGLAATIDQAVVASDGGNLHPDLANLLKRSLVPRDQRIGDVVTWHKILAKLMFDGQYNPTTFNLAFFMHNLFRDEIERESQEIEHERTTQIPIPQVAPAPAAPRGAAAAAAAAAAPAVVRDTPGPVREDTNVLREKYGIDEKRSAAGPNRTVLAAAGIGLLAVLGVVGYLVFGRGGSSAAPVEVPVATPAPAPAGPTPDEIQAQIEKVVQEKLQNSSAQYENQLKALQKQLEDARKAQEARVATPTPTPMPTRVVPTPEPEVRATPAPPVATPTPAPTPAPTPTVESRPVATATPEVKLGELVTMGPGVTPPRVVRKPSLRYPPLAQRMKKEATVVVRVLVDENGRVADAQATGAKAGFGLDEAAVDYARACTYSPAVKFGVNVRMWTDLKVAFNLGGGG
jgi:serine/threonine-protein kinase